MTGRQYAGCLLAGMLVGAIGGVLIACTGYGLSWTYASRRELHPADWRNFS